MNPIISVLDNYAGRPLVGDMYVERSDGKRGNRPDEQRIAAVLPLARV